MRNKIWWMIFLISSFVFVLACLWRDYRKVTRCDLPVQKTEAMVTCKSLCKAVVQYIDDTGIEPQKDKFIDCLLCDDGSWRYAYLELEEDYLDPWGSEYVLELTNNIVRVSSLGPDQALGTIDDIRTSEERK